MMYKISKGNTREVIHFYTGRIRSRFSIYRLRKILEAEVKEVDKDYNELNSSQGVFKYRYFTFKWIRVNKEDIPQILSNSHKEMELDWT